MKQVRDFSKGAKKDIFIWDWYFLTFWSEDWVNADLVKLVTSCSTSDDVHRSPRVCVITLCHFPSVHRPKTFVGMLVRLHDDIHAFVIEKLLKSAAKKNTRSTTIKMEIQRRCTNATHRRQKWSVYDQTIALLKKCPHYYMNKNSHHLFYEIDKVLKMGEVLPRPLS